MFDFHCEAGVQIRKLETSIVDQARFQRQTDIQQLKAKGRDDEAAVILEDTRSAVRYLVGDESDQVLLEGVSDDALIGNTSDAAFRERSDRRQFELSREIIGNRRIRFSAPVAASEVLKPVSTVSHISSLPGKQPTRREAGIRVAVPV